MKARIPLESAFTLVEIMIVVAIIALLASIAVPNFIHARNVSVTDTCINNLRQIDGAKQQWALETGKTAADTPADGEIQPYLGRGSAGGLGRVYCPLVRPPAPMAGYTVNAVGTPPVCQKYDATEHAASLN